MTEKHTSTDPAELSPVEARGGRPVKGMPVVLTVSIIAIVALLAIVVAYFA